MDMSMSDKGRLADIRHQNGMDMAYDMPPSPMARDVAFLLKHFDAKATEVERLRAENANLKRLLDDANERAAQIEDWQVKCALLEVDRDKARGENAVLTAERDRLREALDNARVGLTGRYAPDAG